MQILNSQFALELLHRKIRRIYSKPESLHKLMEKVKEDVVFEGD